MLEMVLLWLARLNGRCYYRVVLHELVSEKAVSG